MARDGLFFKSVGWLSPRTGAPVVAIVIQGAAATIIALSGRYEQILNLRRVRRLHLVRADRGIAVCIPACEHRAGVVSLTPGHPYTTALFVLACAGIVGSTFLAYPANSAIGLAILLTGVPVYLYWSRRKRRVNEE